MQKGLTADPFCVTIFKGEKQVEEDRGESATWQHAFVALGRLKLTKLLNALFRTQKKRKIVVHLVLQKVCR